MYPFSNVSTVYSAATVCCQNQKLDIGPILCSGTDHLGVFASFWSTFWE